MDKGIYPKYVVFKHPDFEMADAFVTTRYDEGNETGVEVYDLEQVKDFTFVLKPLKDRHARLALAVYAESVRSEKPRLAAELKEILDDFQGT
jgi:hypothetical protein